MSVPEEHLVDSQALTPDGIVHLFEITLNDKTSIVRFTEHPSVTWDGKLWEQRGIKVTGERRTASDEKIRPKIQIQQSNGEFDVYIQNGLLENAIVTRYMVLKENLDSDTVLYVTRSWYISQIPQHTRDFVVGNMDSMHEGPKAQVPGRIFAPPDFPVMRLR